MLARAPSDAVAQGNAWHYWWMYPSGENASSTGALVEAGAMTKRGWALGNWARFVRPGHSGVHATGSTFTLRVTAFASADSRRFTVVVVNSSPSAQSLKLSLTGSAPPHLTPWETSATRSLESLAVVPPGAGGVFALAAPARSITTFVGDIPATPELSLSTALVTENSPVGRP